MSTEQSTQTTVADAIRDLEIEDVLAIREEIALTGHLTDTAGNALELDVTSDQALAELDEWIAARS